MTKTMKIDGMMCGHCEARVKKALEAVEGVTEAVVSHTAGTAVVTLAAPVLPAVEVALFPETGVSRIAEVTLDYGLRTGLAATDLLRPDLVTVPAGAAPILMEVKWDAYLPDIIRRAVALPGRRAAAFSKYAQCRIYG